MKHPRAVVLPILLAACACLGLSGCALLFNSPQKTDRSSMSLKLLEMGCIPGERVEVRNIAPMGDPIVISVSGYLLSLRMSEASAILVMQENFEHAK